MFTIVEHGYLENSVSIHCPECLCEQASSTLFFNDNKIVSSCIVCGHKVKDESYILSQSISCDTCGEPVNVQNVRENRPCRCGETMNKVVAIKSYRSVEVTAQSK